MATTIEQLRQKVQLERQLIARLKTANIRFTEAQVERIWAIVSAHQAGLSIRKIAGLSSSRIHQLLNAPEAKEIPVWLSQLRQSSRGSGGKKKAERPESETEIRSCLAREVEVLRRCTDWLQRLEHGENVVVNLRPDEDVETEFVAFDRLRVVRVVERIAADLDTLSLVPNNPHANKESNHHDLRARHRHELAEPTPKPKKLSHREPADGVASSAGTTATIRKSERVQKTERLSGVLGSVAPNTPSLAVRALFGSSVTATVRSRPAWMSAMVASLTPGSSSSTPGRRKKHVARLCRRR